MEQLLKDYGYIMVFLGTFFEGETVLVLAGFLAFRGYLNIAYVIISAIIGAFVGNIFFYSLGRWKGKAFLMQSRKFREIYPRAEVFIRKWGVLSIFIGQYFYGTRIACVVALGVMSMNLGRFLLYEFIGNITWAVSVGLLGFLFGETMDVFIGNMKKYEKFAIIGLIILGSIYWVGWQIYQRHKNKMNNK